MLGLTSSAGSRPANYLEGGEARAVWFSRFEYDSETEIRTFIAQAQEAHLNAIFFQVRGTADAFYFSNYEPWSDRLGGSYPGYDPLAVAIEEAHRRGLELHAYVNVMPMWGGPSLPSSPNHIYDAHRDWVMVNESGVLMNPADGYAFGSPGIPEFQNHLCNVLIDILDKYDIDGLHLDYIRYPGRNYSYDPISLQRFKAETGRTPSEAPSLWTQWRQNQVSNLVKRIYEGVRAKKPWVKVSAATWGNYWEGLTYYLQDSWKWLREGYLDFAAPMTYEADLQQFHLLVAEQVNHRYGRHIYAGIGVSKLDASGILTQIEEARNIGAQGIALFSLSNLNDPITQALATGPYARLADNPAMPWKPVVSMVHQPLHDTENTSTPYAVIAEISSPVSLVADSVLLYWAKQDAGSFAPVIMQPQGNDRYLGWIPLQVNQTIRYFLWAKNDSGFLARDPRWAPLTVHSFYAGPDTYGPVIAHVGLSNVFVPQDSYILSVTVSDNLGVDSTSVLLHYYLNRGPEDSLWMQPQGQGLFSAAMPGAATYGDSVWYFISAKDLAAAPNRTVSPSYRFIVGEENFEEESPCWLSESGWEITRVDYQSPTHALHFTPSVDFQADSSRSFTLAQGLNLESFRTASLSYWTKYSLEESYFFGYVEISGDGGQTWAALPVAHTGYQDRWIKSSVSLSAYCGAGFSDVRLRFRIFAAVSPGQEQIEWLLDDLRVAAGETPVRIADSKPPLLSRYFLSRSFPNPFNSGATIYYHIPVPSEVKITIFNILGEEIRELVASLQSAGVHRVNWDGKDASGRPIASGLYFYLFEAGQHVESRKAVHIR